MSRARRLAVELATLALIACAAGALLAAIVVMATAAPARWPSAFLQVAPVFACLVFSGAMLLSIMVGNPPARPAPPAGRRA